MLQTLRATGAPSLRFTLYPTGEFSATKVKEASSLLGQMPSASYEELSRWDESSYAVGQVSDGMRAKLVRSTLGSSNVLNSHKARKARGRKGISRYNKRLIVNSCLLLERKYGRKHLSFLTLTLPPECANREADAYREAKRQMLQWLQRRLDAGGLPCEVVGCTEVQASRLHRKAQFALHEHWIFVGRLPHKSWALKAREVQSKWLQILGCVFKVVIGESNMQAAVNVQRVKRSAGAYLGKYVSKGCEIVEYAAENGMEHMLPSSWVTRSLSMLKMFRVSILKIMGEKASMLHSILNDNSSMYCRWSRNLTIEIESGLKVWLAFVGYLNPAGMQVLNFFNT